MAIGNESHCVRHKNTKAKARCRQCGAPFCGECHIDVAEGDFCSVECLAKLKRFANNSEGQNWKRPSRFVSRTLSFVAMIVIIAVALHFAGINVPIVSPMLR
jgi:hypothetical protein